MPLIPSAMKTPFYLGTRSLALFEAALRDVERDELCMVLDKVSSERSADRNPRKQKLVEAEIARREAGNHAAAITMILSLLGCMGVLLSA